MGVAPRKLADINAQPLINGEYVYRQQIILKVDVAMKEIGAQIFEYSSRTRIIFKASQYSIVLTPFANFSVRAFRQIKVSPTAILWQIAKY